ncbi:MAG: iron sulfur protein [Actinomycetia bacterium]|jgi:Rieske Fe-S protein|nr:iron sulfur protein [Actinomycetes bacterium]
MGENARPGDEVGATTRRHVVGAGLIGLAVTVTGCGKDSGSGKAAGGGQASGAALQVKTTDIPVGGGKVFDQEKIVVTQPTAGEFKAFSAVCTHQGCTVKKIANGIITCPCHQSQFKIGDGSVAGGPAPAPLPSKTVTVTGTDLKIADK